GALRGSSMLVSIAAHGALALALAVAYYKVREPKTTEPVVVTFRAPAAPPPPPGPAHQRHPAQGAAPAGASRSTSGGDRRRGRRGRRGTRRRSGRRGRGRRRRTGRWAARRTRRGAPGPARRRHDPPGADLRLPAQQTGHARTGATNGHHRFGPSGVYGSWRRPRRHHSLEES